jgi:hypothetical protein
MGTGHPRGSLCARHGQKHAIGGAPGLWCNGRVTLSDGDVAVLARQVVDRRDPDLDIEIVPADPVDPYRWGVPAWTVSAGGATSYLTADMSAVEALAKLIADLDRP